MRISPRYLLLAVALPAIVCLGYIALPTGQASPSTPKANTHERAASSTSSGDPIFMDLLPGISGTATTPGFVNWVEVTSFRWGGYCPGAGSQAALDSISVTSPSGPDSPLLLNALANDVEIPSMVVDFTTGNRITYSFTFTYVYVASYQITNTGATPEDSISFSFGTYKMSYTPYAANGVPGTPVSSSGIYPPSAPCNQAQVDAARK